MIYGVGTDIANITRMREMYKRQGERALQKILAPTEIALCEASPDPARFLAKRFAAKEALGKAYGTGIREPLLLPDIAIEHDAMGKPEFSYSIKLAQFFAEKNLIAHLSISDEREFAIAFVVLERA